MDEQVGIEELLPTAERGFTLFNAMTQEAICAETMYTLHEAYLNDSELIFSKLKQCVDRLLAEKPRRTIDCDPRFILSRTIQLAIPDLTQPKHWLLLYKAIAYGKTRGVRIVITRIAG
jgi:hypothetical protein